MDLRDAQRVLEPQCRNGENRSHLILVVHSHILLKSYYENLVELAHRYTCVICIASTTQKKNAFDLIISNILPSAVMIDHVNKSE